MVGNVVVVGKTVDVVGKVGIVIVDGVVGGSTVIPVVGGSTGMVDPVELPTDDPPSLSSSVAASATIAPAASATSRRATRAIQSHTGDSRDQTIVRA